MFGNLQKMLYIAQIIKQRIKKKKTVRTTAVLFKLLKITAEILQVSGVLEGKGPEFRGCTAPAHPAVIALSSA